jgi:hypothetical protein
MTNFEISDRIALFLASKEASSVEEIGSELAENSHSELMIQHFLPEFHELKVVANNLDIGMHRNRYLTVSNAPNSKRIGTGILLAVYSTSLDNFFVRPQNWGGRPLCIWGGVAGTCLSCAEITDFPAKHRH